MICPPSELLVCPLCNVSSDKGFKPEELRCDNCTTEFFAIDQVPCLFSNGLKQKQVWESTLGPMLEQWRLTIEQNSEDVQRRDLIPLLRQRLEKMIELDQLTYETFQNLMVEKSGLSMRPADENSLDAEIFSGYQALLFRDWHWEDKSKENHDALERILPLIEKKEKLNVLILGSGAGRLSWDLHCELKPNASVALDYSPILNLFSKRLIVDKETISLGDTRPYPQTNQQGLTRYELTCPDGNDDLRQSWYPLAADINSAPLKEHSFDLIISPWFVDVCGQELRETIAQVDRWLKPGGQWINSGPLLYLDSMPYVLRYTFEEIKEFIKLSGLEFVEERSDLITYLKAPNDNRTTQEEVWTFSVRKPTENQYTNNKDEPPAWMVMTHIPIPKIDLQQLPDHPIIIETYERIDGKNSIDDIAKIIDNKFSPDCDCVELVLGLIDEYIYPRSPSV